MLAYSLTSADWAKEMTGGDMDEATIYRKTRKGAQEVAERKHGLPKNMRHVLIVIDGNRSVGQLSALAQLGELKQAILQLKAGGYIEAPGADNPEPARTGKTQPANGADLFALVKQHAMAEISDRLGLVGNLLIEEIERCSSPLELGRKLRNIENALVRLLGPAEGADIVLRIRGQLDRLVSRTA
jgi:hypothetical protein